MEIVTLLENSKKENNLVSEHGLSLLIKRGGEKILFDTGSSGSFIDNAEILGEDLMDVKNVVISHAHYDHAGGLLRFLQINQKANVYLGKDADRKYFSKILFLKKEIGMDRGTFFKHPARIRTIDGMKEIRKDVFIIADMEKKYAMPAGNKYLYVMEGNSLLKDDFRHELIMVVKEAEGIVVFTGCSHKGILNMTHAARNLFKEEKIKALIGGFHFTGIPRLNTMGVSKGEVEDTAKEMMKLDVGKIYTGHCTGEKAYEILKSLLGERLESLYTGSRILL